MIKWRTILCVESQILTVLSAYFCCSCLQQSPQMGFGVSAEVSGVQSLVPAKKYIGDSFSYSMARYSLSAEPVYIRAAGRMVELFFCLIIQVFQTAPFKGIKHCYFYL